MEAFFKKLALFMHWLCFAIGVAVLTAILMFYSQLDALFISMSLGFSLISLLVGSAIRWMFLGAFVMFPWKR